MASKAVLSQTELPGRNTPVELIFAPTSKPLSTIYTSRILRREGRRDYLDAVRTLDGIIVAPKGPARLRWRNADGLWEAPITVRGVMYPMPLLEVRYRDTPVLRDERQEPRYAAHPRGWAVVAWPDQGLLRYRTVARDASRSAVRCFMPVHLELGTVMTGIWEIGASLQVQGRMRVYAIRASGVQYREWYGWDIVAHWDPFLEDEELAHWMTYLQTQPME